VQTNIVKKCKGHAQKRSQQRGIRPWVIKFILDYSDIRKPAGKGARYHLISKRKLDSLVCKEIIKRSEAERLRGVVVLEKGNVWTVYHKTRRLKS